MNNLINQNTTFAIITDPNTGIQSVQVINVLSINEIQGIFNEITGQIPGIQKEINDKNTLLNVLQSAIDLYNASQPLGN